MYNHNIPQVFSKHVSIIFSNSEVLFGRPFPSVSCQVSGCQKLFNSICTVRSWPMGKDTLCNLSTPDEGQGKKYTASHWCFCWNHTTKINERGPTRQPTPLPGSQDRLFHPSAESDGRSDDLECCFLSLPQSLLEEDALLFHDMQRSHKQLKEKLRSFCTYASLALEKIPYLVTPIPPIPPAFSLKSSPFKRAFSDGCW